MTEPSSLLRAGPPLCPASVLCTSGWSSLGVLPLDDQGAETTHFDWPSLSRRQVLLFHASACDELTPPLHRTPPGQPPGCLLAHGCPKDGPAFIPGTMRFPGFDVIVPRFDASAVVHSRSSSRRSPDRSRRPFPQRSPPRLLTAAACGGLGSPPDRRSRRAFLHHRHSTVHDNDLLHRHHSPFRTHRRIGDPGRTVYPSAPGEMCRSCSSGSGLRPLDIRSPNDSGLGGPSQLRQD